MKLHSLHERQAKKAEHFTDHERGCSAHQGAHAVGGMAGLRGGGIEGRFEGATGGRLAEVNAGGLCARSCDGTGIEGGAHSLTLPCDLAASSLSSRKPMMSNNAVGRTSIKVREWHSKVLVRAFRPVLQLSSCSCSAWLSLDCPRISISPGLSRKSWKARLRRLHFPTTIVESKGRSLLLMGRLRWLNETVIGGAVRYCCSGSFESGIDRRIRGPLI